MYDFCDKLSSVYAPRSLDAMALLIKKLLVLISVSEMDDANVE